MGTVTSIATGIGSVPFKIAKTSKRRSRHEEKKQRRSGQYRRYESRGPVLNESKTPHEIGTNSAETESHADKTFTKKENKNHRTATAENSSGDISDSKAPGNGLEKATIGPDMGKHTASGEPLSQKRDADNEAHDKDDESEMSDDPEDNAIEEMAQDVGAGVGKTAEAIARAPMDLSLAIAQGMLFFYFHT